MQYILSFYSQIYLIDYKKWKEKFLFLTVTCIGIIFFKKNFMTWTKNARSRARCESSIQYSSDNHSSSKTGFSASNLSKYQKHFCLLFWRVWTRYFRLIFQYKMCSLSMLKEVGKVKAQPPKWCFSSPATISTRNLLIGISFDGIHSHQPADNCCWQSWQERCWMKEEEIRSKLTTIRFLDVILHPRKIRFWQSTESEQDRRIQTKMGIKKNFRYRIGSLQRK